jgi:hypothetical protein
VPPSDFFTGVQRFAGQALGQAQQGYKQLDKDLGGWLPGGGVASPATRAVRSIPKSDIYKTVRDTAVVPLIDRGMEAGLIPGSIGMYGRYLTGTDKPLTRVPKDVKEAEAVRSEGMFDPQNYRSNTPLAYQPSNDRITREEALTNTLGQYEKKGGTIFDRYDFNSYEKPGEFSAGVEGKTGENTTLQAVSEEAGRIADKMGFITPNSGYDVRLNLPSKTNPLIQDWRSISNKLSAELKKTDDTTPAMLFLSKKETELRNRIQEQGFRLPAISQ